MNALEIIERLREHRAQFSVEGERLIVRGKGDPLPEDLRSAIREHKAEILAAFGVPQDAIMAEILTEIRPHLPRALRDIPDAKLLVLVNWSLMHALAKTVAEFQVDRQ